MSVIHTVGDIGTDFITTIVDQDGAAVDLSTATTQEMRFMPPTGAVRVLTTTFVTDGTDAQVRYVSISGDLDISGAWQREVRVVLASGKEWRSEVEGFLVKPGLGEAFSSADLVYLEAINLMLAAIGEPPVENFLGNLQSDVMLAMRILDAADRSAQLAGYSFNVEEDVALTPVAGVVTLGADVIAISPLYMSDRFAIRGGKVFDRNVNASDEFVGDIRVNLIRKLPFADLPLDAREFITATAVRMFAERVIGSADSALRSDEAIAFARFMQQEAVTDKSYLPRNDIALSRIVGRRSPSSDILR